MTVYECIWARASFFIFLSAVRTLQSRPPPLPPPLSLALHLSVTPRSLCPTLYLPLSLSSLSPLSLFLSLSPSLLLPSPPSFSPLLSCYTNLPITVSEHTYTPPPCSILAPVGNIYLELSVSHAILI